MKKAGISILLLFMMLSIVLSGCSTKQSSSQTRTPSASSDNSSKTTPTSGSTASSTVKPVTVKIFQFKVEIAPQLLALAAAYEKTHQGVTIKVDTVGGGADYNTALKGKFASGDAPDIFNVEGYTSMDLWLNKLQDLSDQPWVKDLVPSTKGQATKNGKLYGMPMSIEGYGFIYNKDLFKKAGIDKLPTTLTELKATAEKLKKAGIIPFENAWMEWWVLGMHNMNIALSRQSTPDKFIQGIEDGSVKFQDNQNFKDWTNLIDAMKQYSQPNPLTTDYNTQIANFANGKAAMMKQGNWTQPLIDKINPKMHLGILPMPINDTPDNSINVGVPNNWVVYKDAPAAEKKAALDFLNWMVSSQTGKDYIVKQFKFIPALKSIPVGSGQLEDLDMAVESYIQKDNVRGWYWPMLPDGATQKMAASIQKYISGIENKQQMLTELTTTIQNLAKKK